MYTRMRGTEFFTRFIYGFRIDLIKKFYIIFDEHRNDIL